MDIFSINVDNSLKNINYILVTDNNEAVIFDPFDNNRIEDLLSEKNLKPVLILNTHLHPDHIKSNEVIQKRYKIDTCFDENFSKQFINGISIKAIPTPGHTDDHLCYIINFNDNIVYLISGDTIFDAGVGNCKNGGDVKSLFYSIQKLKNINKETIILPSHFYGSNNIQFALSITNTDEYLNDYKDQLMNNKTAFKLKDHMKMNLFFRTDEEWLQKKLNTKDSLSTFIKLRELRDRW